MTGAARGLGAAIVRELAAEEGCAVAVTDVDGAAAAELADDLGEGAIPLVLDVRDRGSIERAVAETVERLGEISVLVNNAGVNPGRAVGALRRGGLVRPRRHQPHGRLPLLPGVGARMLQGPGGAIVNLASVQARDQQRRARGLLRHEDRRARPDARAGGRGGGPGSPGERRRAAATSRRASRSTRSRAG